MKSTLCEVYTREALFWQVCGQSFGISKSDSKRHHLVSGPLLVSIEKWQNTLLGATLWTRVPQLGRLNQQKGAYEELFRGGKPKRYSQTSTTSLFYTTSSYERDHQDLRE
jgi:hypothetical protein